MIEVNCNDPLKLVDSVAEIAATLGKVVRKPLSTAVPFWGQTT